MLSYYEWMLLFMEAHGKRLTVKRELGEGTTVISTGGFGAQISHEISSIDIHEPDLVLEGLQVLHQRIQG